VTASFNVALEGPYMSVFFWTLLGLLFVMPRTLAQPSADPVLARPGGSDEDRPAR
jgi:hypothetical protein